VTSPLSRRLPAQISHEQVHQNPIGEKLPPPLWVYLTSLPATEASGTRFSDNAMLSLPCLIGVDTTRGGSRRQSNPFFTGADGGERLPIRRRRGGASIIERCYKTITKTGAASWIKPSVRIIFNRPLPSASSLKVSCLKNVITSTFFLC
jgi:hypothetical protein